jgi:hypothetical protein
VDTDEIQQAVGRDLMTPLQIRERRILQENQKQVCASKLPQTPKKGINTIFNHSGNTYARGFEGRLESSVACARSTKHSVKK